MSYLNELSHEERQRVLALIAEVGDIHSHLGLLEWLAGDAMQQLLPHRALIAAWGDFHGGAIRFDIVSSLPSVRTSTADAAAVVTRMRQLFVRWTASPRRPCIHDAGLLEGIASGLQTVGRSVVVHARRDLRTHQSCCYALVVDAGAQQHRIAAMLELLLPHVDTAYGQVAPLPAMDLHAIDAFAERRQATASRAPLADQITVPSALSAGMTDRELQIMRWVEMGKTNQEIGSILDISAFTVKNHLQRIFKKLDVYSRAQAVSRFKDSMFYG